MGHPPSACVRLTLAGGGRPLAETGSTCPRWGPINSRGSTSTRKEGPVPLFARRPRPAPEEGDLGSTSVAGHRLHRKAPSDLQDSKIVAAAAPYCRGDRRRRGPRAHPRCLCRARGRCGRAQTRARSKGAEQHLQRLTVRAAAQPERLPSCGATAGRLGGPVLARRGLAARAGRPSSARSGFRRLRLGTRGQRAARRVRVSRVRRRSRRLQAIRRRQRTARSVDLGRRP